VVIGYDARHGSDRFALDTAAVLTGAGLTAWLLPGPLPTPVLAFAVRYLGASAGVMVTASHNPPQDNGYKIYWHDGAQIVPPLDAEISAAIDAVGRVDHLPLSDTWIPLDQQITDAYLHAITVDSWRFPHPEGVPVRETPRLNGVRVAYTALHGVGAGVLGRAFKAAGFGAPMMVSEQVWPDPDFPTVAFPNPEEPGAMDLVLALAEAGDADLAIANDPDADRLAVAVPPVDSWRFPHSGGVQVRETPRLNEKWRVLTGDEVGGLLAEHVLRRTRGDDRLVVTTIVSSSLLSKIARAHGVRFAESLTGFKWIMRAGTGRFVFGYEEALGYCIAGDEPVVPEAPDDPHVPVRDKDGIGAALAITALATEAAQEGLTLLDLLDDQARRYGLHATAQLSVRVDDPTLITDAMTRLRADPPAELGGRRVVLFEDLADGPGGLPPTEGLRLRLAPRRPADLSGDGAALTNGGPAPDQRHLAGGHRDGAARTEDGAAARTEDDPAGRDSQFGGLASSDTRVVIRPSGTEPKLKCYLETVIPVQGEVAETRAQAASDLATLKSALAELLALA
jgi:phosphomannomutase